MQRYNLLFVLLKPFFYFYQELEIMGEQEQIVDNPNEVVADMINHVFTYINYFMVAALVVLLTYITIRDYIKKKNRKKLEEEIKEYRQLNNKNDEEERE